MIDDIERFYRENYNLFVKRMSYRAGSIENAEDVVQEAFARAMQYREAYNPDKQLFGAWFSTILINALRDFKREEKNRGTFIEIGDLEEDEHETTDDQHMERNLLNAIVEEIDKFSPAQSRILTLAFVNHYHPRDIRRVVDSTHGYIRFVMTTFRKHVKDKFGEGIYL